MNPITLVGYLQSKGIIGDEIGEGSGKYQINVETLTGKTQKYGNGTATESEKNDVYMLEKVDTSTGNLINKKVASITPIKIAATTNSTVKYKIIYYGMTSETLDLGDLIDTEEIVQSANLITFTIEGTEYHTEEGMTWRKWVTEYKSDEFFIESETGLIGRYAGGDYVSTIEDAHWRKWSC